MATKAKAVSRRVAKPNQGDVATFFLGLDEATRAECTLIDAWMAKVAGPGTMFGKAIVGYGSKTLRYADGRETEWMKMGFSPRKRALTLYGLLGDGAAELLAKLGKHSTGKGCLYVRRIADIDARVLQELIARAGA